MSEILDRITSVETSGRKSINSGVSKKCLARYFSGTLVAIGAFFVINFGPVEIMVHSVNEWKEALEDGQKAWLKDTREAVCDLDLVLPCLVHSCLVWPWK